MTPTRELALQVQSHLTAAAKYTNIKACIYCSHAYAVVCIYVCVSHVSAAQVCVLVGGMAAQKQERLLGRRPQVVVATPGRLWNLMSEVCV